MCRALEAQLIAAEQKLAIYREKLEELDSSFETTEAATSNDVTNRLAAQQRLETENQYLTSLVVKVCHYLLLDPI